LAGVWGCTVETAIGLKASTVPTNAQAKLTLMLFITSSRLVSH
jgi:hypothetical protein